VLTYAGVMTQPDAGGAPGRAVDHPLAGARYVELTTFRRNGRGVPTPVWFAPSVDDPTLFAVITVDDTGKTKRLAHTRRVHLRACDIRGRVETGAPTFAGTATVVRDAAGVGSVRRAVVRKYGVPARFSDAVEKVTGLVGIRRSPRAGILVEVDADPLGAVGGGADPAA
jgi:PPOX class probable F420-dependent enzyme